MVAILGSASVAAARASALAWAAVLFAVPAGSPLEVPLILGTPVLALAAIIVGAAGLATRGPDGRLRISPSAAVGVLLGLLVLATFLYAVRGLGR